MSADAHFLRRLYNVLSRCAACLLCFGLIAQTPPADTTHAHFLREFSSPEDVAKLPTVLDRSLTVLFGPADVALPGQKMQRPYSVATDSAHRIYVTDPTASRVHIFDFEKSRYSFLGGPDGLLRRPVALAIDADDNVYITDATLGLILVYSARGKFLKYLGRVQTNEPYFASPSGIAIDTKTRHLYVCDPPSQMVVMLDEQGRILGHFGKRRGGNGPGEFRNPTRIAISGDDLIVLDSGNSRLQILDLEGHYRREIHIPELNVETGLAIDAQKDIYVGNLALDSIDVFSYDGQFLYRFGGIGDAPGLFNHPCGIWLDAQGRLYVTDMHNERVQIFQLAPPS